MKTSIWKRFFRRGLDTKSAAYNSYNAKRESKTSRTKLNRLLNKLLKEQDD